MADIAVLSKRKFRFAHPDMRTSEGYQKAMGEMKHGEELPGFFTTEPDELRAQVVPDWIKLDPLFTLAEKDGDIFEVPMPSPTVAVKDKVNDDSKKDDSKKAA